MKAPAKHWTEIGSPKSDPNEWGPSSRAWRCVFGHDIHMCGCAMYQCRKCLVCWSDYSANADTSWRPVGYWDSWEGRDEKARIARGEAI